MNYVDALLHSKWHGGMIKFKVRIDEGPKSRNNLYYFILSIIHHTIVFHVITSSFQMMVILSVFLVLLTIFSVFWII